MITSPGIGLNITGCRFNTPELCRMAWKPQGKGSGSLEAGLMVACLNSRGTWHIKEAGLSGCL